MGRRETIDLRFSDRDRVMEGVDHEQTEDVRLQPPTGKSRSEVAAEMIMEDAAKSISAQRLETEPVERAQFSIRDMLLLTTCGAIGASGGYWIPAGLFAGLVGLSMLLVITVMTLTSPELRLLRTVWWCFSALYLSAAFAAIIKTAS